MSPIKDKIKDFISSLDIKFEYNDSKPGEKSIYHAKIKKGSKDIEIETRSSSNKENKEE